jgi:hypothetical protein
MSAIAFDLPSCWLWTAAHLEHIWTHLEHIWTHLEHITTIVLRWNTLYRVFQTGDRLRHPMEQEHWQTKAFNFSPLASRRYKSVRGEYAEVTLAATSFLPFYLSKTLVSMLVFVFLIPLRHIVSCSLQTVASSRE